MNELEKFGKDLASIGLPLLGAALPFPGGAALGTALAHWINSPSTKPADILAHLQQNSEAMEKAREFEAQNHATILQITVNAEIERDKADTARQESVNQTMQAESASSQGEPLWRQLCGFTVAIGSFVTLCAALYLAHGLIFSTVQNAAASLSMLPSLVLMITGILSLPASAVGIATWHGGHVDRLKAAAAAANNTPAPQGDA